MQVRMDPIIDGRRYFAGVKVEQSDSATRSGDVVITLGAPLGGQSHDRDALQHALHLFVERLNSVGGDFQIDKSKGVESPHFNPRQMVYTFPAAGVPADAQAFAEIMRRCEVQNATEESDATAAALG